MPPPTPQQQQRRAPVRGADRARGAVPRPRARRSATASRGSSVARTTTTSRSAPRVGAARRSRRPAGPRRSSGLSRRAARSSSASAASAPPVGDCAILAPVADHRLARPRRRQLDLPTAGRGDRALRAFDDEPGRPCWRWRARRAARLPAADPASVFLFTRRPGAQRPELPGAMVGFAFLGPVLLALQGILGYFGQSELASDFVDSYVAGGDVYTLLDDLTDDSTLARPPAEPGLRGDPRRSAWRWSTSRCRRCGSGCLTRFFATLGMALGVATILLLAPDAAARHALVPVARPGLHRADAEGPPARLGRRRGDPLAAARRGAAGAADRGRRVVDGDATEVFAAPEPVDHSARRERAKKRKRKRRG